MPAKCTISSDATVKRVIRELSSLKGKTIKIGPNCADGSHLALIAGANEFGATIKAKKGFLAIPLIPEAKGKRPADFGSELFFVPGSNKGHGFLARENGKNQIQRVFILKKQVTIPERSYLRSTFDRRETHDRAERILDDMIKRLIAGTATADMILLALGESYVSSVKQRISSNIQPANAPLTAQLKGGRKGTLIDKADLLKSISSEVV